jgi:glutaminyl-tRNA synthetase
METTKILSPELLGADKALCRAAIKVKQGAERLGMPYVVTDGKDSVAGKPVFNRTVTLRDAWQK